MGRRRVGAELMIRWDASADRFVEAAARRDLEVDQVDGSRRRVGQTGKANAEAGQPNLAMSSQRWVSSA